MANKKKPEDYGKIIIINGSYHVIIKIKDEIQEIESYSSEKEARKGWVKAVKTWHNKKFKPQDAPIFELQKIVELKRKLK